MSRARQLVHTQELLLTSLSELFGVKGLHAIWRKCDRLPPEVQSIVTPEQIQIATRLDAEVRRLAAADNNDIAIFAAMTDFMPDFKRLMDSSQRGELDELCGRFAGLYRYAKILEMIAAGIQSGEIKVPK